MESMDDLDSISVDTDTINQSNLDLLNYFDDAAFNQLTQSLDASPSVFDFNIAASSVQSSPSVFDFNIAASSVRSGPVRSGPVRSGRGRGHSRISASAVGRRSPHIPSASASAAVGRREKEPSRIITRSSPLIIRKAFRIVLKYCVRVRV